MGSGSRIVFDEEGTAMDPLERLATTHMAGGSSEAGGSGAGVYVVSERPEERFKLAADLMRARDREDKQRLKQLKKVGRGAGARGNKSVWGGRGRLAVPPGLAVTSGA